MIDYSFKHADGTAKKIDKRVARNLYNGGQIIGLCASNLRPERFCSFHQQENPPYCDSFEVLCNSFSFYNCNAEAGRRISFFSFTADKKCEGGK